MPSSPSQTLERATDLVRRGQAADGVALLEDALRQVRTECPAESAEVMRASGELASVLFFLKEDERAASLLDEVTRMPRSELEEEKYRLTLLLNLAEALERSGNWVLAEDACRRGIQGRHRVYGPDHAGYAFGLVPLAQVLLKQEKLDAARETVVEAIANFKHHAHPWLSSTLALAAEIDAALGKASAAWWEGMDDDQLGKVAQEVFARAPGTDPRSGSPLLQGLADALEERRGAADPLLREALTLLANLEAAGGDARVREHVLTRLLRAHQAAGDEKSVLEAQIGLALCARERGELTSAQERMDAARNQAASLDAESRSLVRQAEAFLATPQNQTPIDSTLIQKAADALRTQVKTRVGGDLINEMHVHFSEEEGGLSVDVSLKREPSEIEKAQLDRAIAEARRDVFGRLVTGEL